MRKLLIFLGACGFAATPAWAQETYQDTKMVDNDLNGTARYVGMGGAMEPWGPTFPQWEPTRRASACFENHSCHCPEA